MNKTRFVKKMQSLPRRWILLILATVFSSMASSLLPNNREIYASIAFADTLLFDTLAGWPRPRFEERKRERLHMVASQMAGVTDVRVLDAMRQVPRHLFVPERVRPYAYDDGPLPIGEGQTISQPPKSP